MSSARPQWVTLLGSTGSIGKQTLSLIDDSSDSFKVYALSAYQDDELLWQQCQRYQPLKVVLTEPQAAQRLADRLRQSQYPTEVLCGNDALLEIAQTAQVDVVVVAIVGFAALAPTMAAIHANKRLLLANKEVFVAAGSLFMQALQQSQATLFPLDSEHHALFECFYGNLPLSAEALAEIQQVTLTASGGPFREWSTAQLIEVTVEQACRHPNWQMGKKISVDSATLMNKGFEIIEAHYLYNLPLEKIHVVLHPQSQVHAFVHYIDGSCQMQLANPDMRLPISRGLYWPQRAQLDLPQLTYRQMNDLRFYEVDPDKYPCFALAQWALQRQGNATTVLNAANEVAVQAFLHREIRYTEIFPIVKQILQQTALAPLHTLQEVTACDQLARQQTRDLITLEYTKTKETV